jgi:hypothetical protein
MLAVAASQPSGFFGSGLLGLVNIARHKKSVYQILIPQGGIRAAFFIFTVCPNLAGSTRLAFPSAARVLVMGSGKYLLGNRTFSKYLLDC